MLSVAQRHIFFLHAVVSMNGRILFADNGSGYSFFCNPRFCKHRRVGSNLSSQTISLGGHLGSHRCLCFCGSAADGAGAGDGAHRMIVIPGRRTEYIIMPVGFTLGCSADGAGLGRVAVCSRPAVAIDFTLSLATAVHTNVVIAIAVSESCDLFGVAVTANTAIEDLNSSFGTCRCFCDFLGIAMAESVNYRLSNRNGAAYRAVLTLGKTGCGTSGCDCCIDYFGVT